MVTSTCKHITCNSRSAAGASSGRYYCDVRARWVCLGGCPDEELCDADRVSIALAGHGDDPEHVVAEGVASGIAIVVNRHSLSPGGLRWLSQEELEHVGDSTPWQGCWALGTGFVVLNPAYDEAYYAACDARDSEILAYADAVDWWDYSLHGRVLRADNLVAEVMGDMRRDLELTRAEMPGAEQALIASLERWSKERASD